jgi:hypothetical protein
MQIVGPVKNSILVLGISAIGINLIFNLLILLLISTGRKHTIAKWIICFNFLLLIFQIYYFFYRNNF